MIGVRYTAKGVSAGCSAETGVQEWACMGGHDGRE